MNTSYFGGRSVEKRMRMVGVGRFCWKISGSGSNLLKYGWNYVVFVETGWEWVFFHQKWLGGGRLCRKMGGSGSLLSKNGWEWVFCFEKWVRMGSYCRKIGRSVSFLSKNGWEWVAFLEKWVRMGCFSWKMDGSGWDWLGAQFGKASVFPCEYH